MARITPPETSRPVQTAALDLDLPEEHSPQRISLVHGMVCRRKEPG